MKLFRDSCVLVSVLDWGLGHASRTSVVVRRLLDRGCRVVLAGSGRSLALLRSDYPDLEVVNLPSFSPKLSSGRVQFFILSAQVPRLLFSIWRERRHMDDLVRRYGVDCIISDNRYGVRSNLCPSFIITHQLNLIVSMSAPEFVNEIVSSVIRRLLRRFDACLVPDHEIGMLSGRLSSPVPPGIRAHRIGLLSRLAAAQTIDVGDEVDWLGIVSGPEPQRSIMVCDLQRRFAGMEGRRIIVCGQPEKELHARTDEGVEMIGYANASMLKSLILSAKHIVCRAGYSTILDLTALEKGAIMRATPGQSEQLYLAWLHGDGMLMRRVGSELKKKKDILYG